VAARILIIDDNVSLAENLREVLEGAKELDVEVRLASAAGPGLAAAERDGFDVAVVDIKLPDGSGVELMRPLRVASPHGEIILVTGFATVDTAIAALRAGAFAFILKSFRPEELISAVAQALEKIALKREREEYERRYRALVDAADVLIVGLDAEGRVTLFNARLSAVTGVPPEVALGRVFAETFVDEADHKRFQHALSVALGHHEKTGGTPTAPAKTGGTPTPSAKMGGTPMPPAKTPGDAAAEIEAGLRDGVGAVRRVRWHLSGVRGVPRKKALVYGIGLDITERRALQRRAADAEALNAMAPLALGLAHEIRNPLNAAVLELHLLGRSIERLDNASVREPMKRRVSIVEAEIKRLERLLTDFLELARPRAPQREPVELARVVEGVLELEAEAVAAHRIEVARDLTPDCFALGDVEKLKQVALNLVVNSLDAMPEGGALRASVGGDEAEVWLSVGDSGPGIDSSILAEIFDPFFTTKAAGTGLGLAIVRKIVDQHQGRVLVDTRKDEGTTVRVVLPRWTEPRS
jgi:signal transduction histidine kinase/FixJ family two-component response regulator